MCAGWSGRGENSAWGEHVSKSKSTKIKICGTFEFLAPVVSLCGQECPRHTGWRLFFVLCELKVKMDDSGWPPEDTVAAAGY
jgi:hypothetical protein